MEKTQNEILEEILVELSAIRMALNSVESRLARLNLIEEEGPIELDEDLEFVDAVAAVDVVADATVDLAADDVVAAAASGTGTLGNVPSDGDSHDCAEAPAEEVPAEEAPAEEAPAEEAPAEDMPAEDMSVEDMPAEDMPVEDMPAEEDVVSSIEEEGTEEEEETEADAPAEEELDIFGMPVERKAMDINEVHRATRKKSVGEAMEKNEAWRTAIPGSPVKDVRSAITLNDRILFIRELFRSDAELFHSTVTTINDMYDLDEVADMLASEFPEWDMNSDTVYRFMMAVRRKLREE